MDTRKLSFGLLSLALLAGAGAWAFALPGQPPQSAGMTQPKGEEADGDEEEVITLDKAPEAVRTAAIKLAGDAKNITKVIMEEDDEDVETYEVEYNDGAVKCAAIFSTAGDLMETEKATTEAKLPAAAMAALKKDYPEATFADPQVVTKVFYEVAIVIDGEKHEVKVDASGNIDDESKDSDEQADKGEGDEHEQKTERGAAPGADSWRADFAVNKADLATTGVGTYFILQPGRTMTYSGGDTTLVVTVLDEARVVDGVNTRVIEERESKAGALIEVSRNFFAIEPKSGDAYYFGEEVDIYKDGKVIKHEGEWLSGKNGAKFGLFIPGAAKVGDRFYQEIAPGHAMDRFEVTSVTEHMQTPAGMFDKVVKTEETSPLEPGKGYKWFAAGVGMIRDDELTLSKIEPGPHSK